MSHRVRRSLFGLIPAIVLLGQTASVFADLARIEETPALSLESSDDKGSSTSKLVIPGLLLAGGALFGLGGMGGGSGSGDSSFFSAPAANGRSLTNPPTGSVVEIPDILTPVVSQPNIVFVGNQPALTELPVVSVTPPAASGSNGSSVVNPSPNITPVVISGDALVNAIANQSFVIPPSAPLPPSAPPSGGTSGNNSGTPPLIPTPAPVPEPGTIMLGSSLLGMGMLWRLRRQKAHRN